MNGIICINKPQEWTSFDVVAKARGIARTKKVGHAGTLDPMATGVLPLFFGAATKVCDLLPNEDKGYLADFRLGVTTDTLDRTGTVLTETESNRTQAEIEAILPQFRGEIKQVPPMYSAIRINGQRLYDLARSGREVERQARPVTIHRLELLQFDPNTQSGRLLVRCSKGTYIRTLAADLGEQLGVGAVLTELQRDLAGRFSLEDCHTLEELQQYAAEGTLSSLLLPIDAVFADLPKIELNEVQRHLFCNGVKLDLQRVPPLCGVGNHRVYDEQNAFLGLARPDVEKEELRIVKSFWQTGKE